jgi:hypothetical protein
LRIESSQNAYPYLQIFLCNVGKEFSEHSQHCSLLKVSSIYFLHDPIPAINAWLFGLCCRHKLHLSSETKFDSPKQQLYLISGRDLEKLQSSGFALRTSFAMTQRCIGSLDVVGGCAGTAISGTMRYIFSHTF